MLAVAACGADPADGPVPGAVTVAAAGCGPVEDGGSGIVVAPGVVVTAAHVVAGSDAVTVVAGDGRRVDAVVDEIDTGLDAAVLRADDLGVVPVRRRGHLRAGERGTVGDDPTPFEVVRRVRINTTDIYRRGRHRRSGYELAAEVAPGRSGAGLVTADGVLGGMVFAASRRTPGRAWALDVDALEPLLAAADGEPAPPTGCWR